ncbi:dynein intermediate chain 3, ciliary-like [Phlebotomus papatasi]|uniref:dynein intermediate chain 3, ciliary-like n=1 Tax=Phlebotomus papatasi TaxID=29031 RepID=UPI002483C714|nr:dynein intermediate chain 3, ciliary-like [Phlebotomus papatasi]
MWNVSLCVTTSELVAWTYFGHRPQSASRIRGVHTAIRMEIQYVYQKERRDFGKQCFFADKNELLFSEGPNRGTFKEYIQRNPMDRETQKSRQMSASEANTERAVFEHKGINHTEGGWPKDVNLADPEQTVRYKRKIEKDESYIVQVMSLTKPMEHCIFQNNAVNIYENYFEDLEPAPLVEKCSSRTVNVYRDPSAIQRNVTHLSWSPDSGKLAVSHCNRDFHEDRSSQSKNSYIWEIENPNAPLQTFEPPSAIVCLEYNQKDPSSLVSGMFSGQVAGWDTRHGKKPIALTDREVSHRDPVNSVLWINSKSGTEFFSGSSDGQVIWWDTRKINEPLDRLLLDPIKTDEQNLDRSYGCSVLEYETTIPTRFMCGSEQGMLFSCNRKGKSPSEKINIRIMCHLGPIYTVARNPAFVKNFLTVGDWTARIWSEDCRESAIIWTKNHSCLLTCGEWSSTKVSMFYISRMDGVLDAWDLLQQQNDPVLSVKVCDEPIRCLRSHEAGRLISVGSQKGATYLIEVSENMSFSTRNDKPLFTAMLEREAKREKILEAKLRELKLKVRAAQKQDDDTEEARASRQAAMDRACQQAQTDYFKTVEKLRSSRNPDLYPLSGDEEEDTADRSEMSQKDTDTSEKH